MGSRSGVKAEAKPEKGKNSGDAAGDAAVRHKILSAALEVFSQQGFEGASIAVIARRHNVSPPLVHYYFKNKTQLWQAAVEFGAGSMITELQGMMNDLSDVDSLGRIKFFIRRYISLLVERPAVFSFIIRESDTPGPRLKWLLQTFFHPLYEIFQKLVEDAQKEGRITSAIPSYHVCQIIAGACYQFIASKNRMIELYGVDPTTREAREQHANYVIEALFSGLVVKSGQA